MSFVPRTWQVIQAQIKDYKNAQAVLAGLTSLSKAAHWQLWTFIQALASNLNEQAMSVFFDEIETVISQGAAQTESWIQIQVLKFQYNVNTPYLVSVTENFVGYINEVIADRIISNCAVVVSATGSIRIKVKTASGPLNASQLIAFNSYLTNFLNPNQKKTTVSVAADKLWVAGTVYYNGQLNASIVDSVIAALDAYITKFSTSQESGGSFNGLVKVTDIAKTIEAVTGVVDWVPTQITVTPVAGSVVNLILASAQSARSYSTYSGYIENDPGNPFSSTLTFVAANN